MAALTPNEKTWQTVMDAFAAAAVASSILKLEKNGDPSDYARLYESTMAKVCSMAKTVAATHPEGARQGPVTWSILRAAFIQGLKECLGDLGANDAPQG